MSDVVNLNRFRKKQKRAAKEKQAQENRTRYGRAKAEKQRTLSEEAAKARHLDAHKRQDDDA